MYLLLLVGTTNGTSSSLSIAASKAAASAVETFNNSKQVSIEYVLDVTIAYQNGVPLDLPNIVYGLRSPCQTYFFYRLYPSSEVIYLYICIYVYKIYN